MSVTHQPEITMKIQNLNRIHTYIKLFNFLCLFTVYLTQARPKQNCENTKFGNL